MAGWPSGPSTARPRSPARWRRPGGRLLLLPAGLHFEAMNSDAVQMPELEDTSIRQFNMVQLGRVLTDAALDPPIRALIVHSSTPAAIAPSQNLVLQGLRREDLFTVVHEQVLTDTARHADYLLPATTEVEHLDLVWSWGHDYLTLNQPAIEPVGEAIPNTELFRRLAAAMGYADAYFSDSDLDLVRLALVSDHPHLAGITYESLHRDGWAALPL